MTAALPISAVLGALLRRIFGGWLGISRPVCVAAIVVVTAAPAWWAWVSFEPWPVPVVGSLPMWARALTVTALAAMFWTDGHRFDRPWMLLVRYGWPPAVLALVSGVWSVAIVGPAVAASAAACRILDLPPVRLPWDRGRRRMIDGWEAWWEISLGAIGVSAFWAAVLG